MPGSPGSPQMMPGSPRPQMHSIPVNQSLNNLVGPPTLSPMMGSEPVPAPIMQVPSTTVAMSQMCRIANSSPVTTSSVPTKPTDSSWDPQTLAKEVTTPMPNLGQPHLHRDNKPLPNLASKPMHNSVFSEGEQGLDQTPTHVIDRHVIKESSQPFPVSPVKGKPKP